MSGKLTRPRLGRPRSPRPSRAGLKQGVPLALVESALLLASLRRLSRPGGLPPLARIRSLAYFQPVIAELQQQPLPNGYLDYLRLKFQQATNTLPNDAQKKTFPDDR